MTELRNRKLRVQIDTLVIDGLRDPGLRVRVKATKSLRKEPNKCEVTVYNLSPEHRGALTKSSSPVVSVSAGYEGALTQIFLGQAIHVRHEWQKSSGDVLTTVSTSDGGPDAKSARTKVSFPKATKPGDVLRVLAKALNVKPGNLKDAIAKLNAGKAASIYAEGCQVVGSVPAFITEICRSGGLEWSIQDGTLQFLDVGKALAQQAIVLGEDLLENTPTVTSKNMVECVTRIQSDLVPGRQIHVKHREATMVARIEKCSYNIDSHADDWTVEIEARGKSQ